MVQLRYHLPVLFFVVERGIHVSLCLYNGSRRWLSSWYHPKCVLCRLVVLPTVPTCCKLHVLFRDHRLDYYQVPGTVLQMTMVYKLNNNCLMRVQAWLAHSCSLVGQALSRLFFSNFELKTWHVLLEGKTKGLPTAPFVFLWTINRHISDKTKIGFGHNWRENPFVLPLSSTRQVFSSKFENTNWEWSHRNILVLWMGSCPLDYLLMEVEVGDDKDIDRLAMPQGMLTPSISGIVCRTFVYNLVLTNLPKLSF